MKISYNGFKGIMPKLAIDKLPEFMAQVASDSKTASGDLVAYRKPLANTALGSSAYKTLFEYLEGGNNNWVYYNLIVHWVRTPTAGDNFERLYMTGADAANGKYKAFVNDIQEAGDFDFTTDFYFPGAPSGTAPSLVASGTGEVVSYFYTYVSRYGEEGPPSALATDIDGDRDLITEINDIESPTAADEHLDTIIDGKIPKVYLYRASSDTSGIAAFLFVLEAEWFEATSTYAVGDYVIESNDIYLCTVPGTGTFAGGTHTFTKGFIVLDAELGAVATSIFYDRCPDDLTNLRGMPGGFFVASKDNTLYFSEPFAPWAWPEDYQIPIDQEIIGIGVYGSTIVVATDGNIYTFSGPHPTSLYKTKLDFQPCLSQRAVVETNAGVMFPSLSGFQHVANGSVENITASMVKPEDWVDFEVETMHGTWYNDAYYGFFKTADNEGFIVIDILNGSITTGVDYHHAGYVAIEGGKFFTIFASELTLPTVLYISEWDADVTGYKNYLFRSKQFILEKPQNFKVAQVILDTQFYDDLLELLSGEQVLQDLNTDAWAENDMLGATFNGASFNKYAITGDTLADLNTLGIQGFVNFKLYIDGALRWTKQVKDSTMFKLPRGFRDKKWEWSVQGMIPIKRIILATSTEEIV